MQSGQKTTQQTDLEKFEALIAHLTFPEKKLFFNTDKRQIAYDIVMKGATFPAEMNNNLQDPVIAKLTSLAAEIKTLKEKISKGVIDFPTAVIKLHLEMASISLQLSSQTSFAPNIFASETINNLNAFTDNHLKPILDNKKITLHAISEVENAANNTSSLNHYKTEMTSILDLLKEVTRLGSLFDNGYNGYYLLNTVFETCNEIKSQLSAFDVKKFADIQNAFISKCKPIVSDLSFSNHQDPYFCERDLMKFYSTKKLLKEILESPKLYLDKGREFEKLYDDVQKNLSSANGKAALYFSGNLSEDNPKAKAIFVLGEKMRTFIVELRSGQKTLANAYEEINEPFTQAVAACRNKSWLGNSQVADILDTYYFTIISRRNSENKFLKNTIFETFFNDNQENVDLLQTSALISQIIEFSVMTNMPHRICETLFSEYTSLTITSKGMTANTLKVFQSSLIHECRDLIVQSTKNTNNKELTDEQFFKEKIKILNSFTLQYNHFLTVPRLLSTNDKYNQCFFNGFSALTSEPEDKKSLLIYTLGKTTRSTADQFSAKGKTLNEGILELSLLMKTIVNNIRALPNGKNSETANTIENFAKQFQNLSNIKKMEDMQLELSYRLDPLNDFYLDTPLLFSVKEEEQDLFLNQHDQEKPDNKELTEFDNLIKTLILPKKPVALFNKRQYLLKLGARGDDVTIPFTDMKDKEIFELGRLIKTLRIQIERHEITLVNSRETLRTKINSVMKVSREKSNLGKSDTADYLDKFVKTHYSEVEVSLASSVMSFVNNFPTANDKRASEDEKDLSAPGGVFEI